jgi:hypothetical protein
MAVAEALPAPATFEWQRWPGTEAFVERLIALALEGNAFAGELAGRMTRETGTRFKDWVDHLVVLGSPALRGTLSALGYERQPMT